MEYEMFSKSKCICIHCGHVWATFVDTPKRCPSCKTSAWNRKKIKPYYKRNPPKGKANCHWNGGTSQYKNHYQLKKNRLTVLKAANYTCQVCGSKADRTHHKDGKKTNHDPENLEAVCARCNKRYHLKYGFDLNIIAKNIGCTYATVLCHVKGRHSKKYGIAIDQTIQQRKENNGSQVK